MRTYIIERNIEGASRLSAEELTDIAAKSNDVVDGLGVPDTWVTSYVAGDKIYCIHQADDASAITEHARCGGFPADLVTEVPQRSGHTPRPPEADGDQSVIRPGGSTLESVTRRWRRSSPVRPWRSTVGIGVLSGSSSAGSGPRERQEIP